jgi:voltage-gated potassium channel
MLFIFDLIKTVVKIRKLHLILITIIFFAGSSFIIHWLEPEMFENPFIGFWYVMTTVTTTGYGDFVPETTMGRIFGLFLYFFGIGLIAIVIGKFVGSLGIYRKLKESGKLRYKGEGHYVIIGCSNKAKHTMNEIIEMDDKAKILLIDTLSKTPYNHKRFYYINGDVTDKKILDKANIQQAKAVLIFTKDNEYNPVAADGKSLLIVSAIESYAKERKKDIYTVVEILKEKHISKFKHANVDEFVIADEVFSGLMAKTAIHKGSSKLIMNLLTRKSGVDLRKVKKREIWKTYNDALEDLKKFGANLVSDGTDFNLLTKLEDPIPEEAELYVICNKETYQNIPQI